MSEKDADVGSRQPNFHEPLMDASAHIHYTECPVCRSENLSPLFGVKDFLTSGETFDLIECRDCGLRITQDIPSPESIGRYYQSENYISHAESAKGLVNRLYLRIRRRTLESKLGLVRKETRQVTGDLLDLGAGAGSFVRKALDNGWKALGIEPDAGARKNAQQLHGVELLPAGSWSNFGPDCFDAITLWHVLEHVHELDNYMQELKRIIRPTGRIFIAVPNFISGDARHYKNFWAAYDAPRHLYHFHPDSMRRLLARTGLSLLRIRPMWYDSYYISLISEKYKSGKARILPALAYGTASNLKALVNRRFGSSLIYVVGK